MKGDEFRNFGKFVLTSIYILDFHWMFSGEVLILVPKWRGSGAGKRFFRPRSGGFFGNGT